MTSKKWRNFKYFQVQQRYVLAVNIFLTFGMTFALRMCFTLLLTQMVYVPNTNIINNNTIDINDELTCPIQYSRPKNESFLVHESSSETKSDRYLWSQKLQGVIVSSFFWGNLVSTIPGRLTLPPKIRCNMFLIQIFICITY